MLACSFILEHCLSQVLQNLVNLPVKQKIGVIIEKLNKYLPSVKFDSYYDDNLLQPEVGAHPPGVPC